MATLPQPTHFAVCTPEVRRVSFDQLQLRKPHGIKANGHAAIMPAPVPDPTNRLVVTGTGPLPLIEDDEDLVPLLRQASNQDLDPLVKFIIEKGGMTSQLELTQAYKLHSPKSNHKMYADDIAAEIQKFGANTFWSLFFRDGKGKKYRKILKSVAKRCDVKVGLSDETAKIEEGVLEAVLSKAYEEMTDGQRQEVLATLKINKLPGTSGPVTAAAFQTAIQAAGFAPYKAAVIVANGMANVALGHGLAFAANTGLTKAIALFAGPVGWTLDAIWGGVIVAGPAYRVTVPCVVQVALIRQSMLQRQREKRRKFLLIAFIVLLAALIARHFVRW
jgi:uncharacterized protein YaaW (UPF0174 family)